MFTDPIVLTIEGTAYDFPRTDIANGVGTYVNESKPEEVFSIGHTDGKRSRRVVRFKKLAKNADGVDVGFTFTFTMDMPLPDVVEDVAEMADLRDGMVAWLTSSNLDRVRAGEI